MGSGKDKEKGGWLRGGGGGGVKGGKEKEKGVGEGEGELKLETLFHKNCSLGSVKNLSNN